MFYKGKIRWYNEFGGKDEFEGFFLSARDYTEAMNKVFELYGDEDIHDEDIQEVYLAVCCPDNILITKDLDIFDSAAKSFEDNGNW